jgi:hypothetical protein
LAARTVATAASTSAADKGSSGCWTGEAEVALWEMAGLMVIKLALYAKSNDRTLNIRSFYLSLNSELTLRP